jgi:putative ABC transport system permease protein
MLSHLRHGARFLVKRPGFTALIVLILALGIGANTAIFSILDAVLLRPLPYRDPDRLVLVFGTQPSQDLTRDQTSPLNFVDLRARCHSLAAIAAVQPATGTLLGAAEPEALNGVAVDRAFFSILGVRPERGRIFTPQEDRPGGELVVMLSHRLWLRQLGGSDQAIGRSVTLDGTPVTVIGVMPADFEFPLGADFWLPLQLNAPAFHRGSNSLSLVARLRAGNELEQAQTELNGIAQLLAREFPDVNEGRGFVVVPVEQELVGQLRPAFLVLLGTVGLVLLIACANAASLLLSRTAARTNEVAVRSALGADRWRIVGQLLTESLLLALASGVAGLLLGAWMTHLLATYGPQEIPRLHQAGLDLRVLGFTLLLTVITVLFFGVAPALQSTKPDLVSALKEGGQAAGTGRSRQRAGKLLVIAELTFALTLMVTAGLLARSFISLVHVRPGFRPDHLLTIDVSLPRWRYKRPDAIAFYGRLLQEVRAMPGVRSAAAVMNRPIRGVNRWKTAVAAAGHAVAPDHQPEAFMNPVTPNYFETLGIPLLAGRDFTAGDDADAPPVVILSERAARLLFPDRDPLGQEVSHDLGFGAKTAKTRTVIGVVGDVRQEGLHLEEEPEIYVPHAQAPFPGTSLVVRTSVAPLSLAGPLRDKIRALDKDLPLKTATTMEDLLAESVGQPRFYMGLVSGFALLGLVLAVAGVYGLLTNQVVQRHREIGVRMALGARAGSVVGMIVRQAVVLAGIGLVLGIAASLTLRRLISSLLFGIGSTDLLTYVLVSATLLTVVLLACVVPALRAVRVNPVISLRSE